MNILVILGHPRAGSFNHAIADAVCGTVTRNGHRAMFHDLCAERFDPLLSADEIPEDGVVPDAIQQHCADLQAADGIVIVHPNWWGQPPAILKGWIDRVIRPGIAYRFQEGDNGEGIPRGLLKARAAIVFNTSNTPKSREQAAFGDPLEALWRRCVFGLCGVPAFHRRMFSVVVTSTPEQRRAWLAEVAALTDKTFPAAVSDTLRPRPHVLFVCGRNMWRSPTAARIYANDQRIQVRSAGVSPQSAHRVSQRDLEWADLVLVMESDHKARLREMFRDTPLPTIECLEIPDDYGFMDEALVELIRAGTEAQLSAKLGIGSNGSPA